MIFTLKWYKTETLETLELVHVPHVGCIIDLNKQSIIRLITDYFSVDQLIDWTTNCLYSNIDTWVFGGTGLMFAMWLEIGRMLSWSSMTTQFLQDASERMNLENSTATFIILLNHLSIELKCSKSHESQRSTYLSLNLPTTSWWASVLYRECTSYVKTSHKWSQIIWPGNSHYMRGDGTGCKLTIVIVYSCLREFIVLSSNTTIPPPSTVSIVLAKRLGVMASKSCVTQKANILACAAYFIRCYSHV